MNPAELAIESRRRSSVNQEQVAQQQKRAQSQSQRLRAGLFFLRPLNFITRLRPREPARGDSLSNGDSINALPIPPTSPERLARAAADKESDDEDGDDDKDEDATVLYLAYGSNLSAQTFLRNRGIRPLSQVNVSAPALDLVFDLPGLPYQEPCFANVAPRKLPKLPLPHPPKKPPHIPPPPPPETPDLPVPDPHPPAPSPGDGAEEDAAIGDTPTWNKGLYGVVYEVTAEDWATIIRTEGGGTSYLDIQTPCVVLPPAFGVPEKPVVPAPPPRPFLAHTLCLPRLPDVPGDDGDCTTLAGKWRKFLARLTQPGRLRPEGSAQPSARYLGLIRTGAREHALPDEWTRGYLGSLRAYARTTWRQEVGRWLFLLLWGPAMIALVALSMVLSGGGGKDGDGDGGGRKPGTVPRWLAIVMTIGNNLMWMSYDAVFKPVFGDGERTEQKGTEEGRAGARRASVSWRRFRLTCDEEKALLRARET